MFLLCEAGVKGIVCLCSDFSADLWQFSSTINYFLDTSDYQNYKANSLWSYICIVAVSCVSFPGVGVFFLPFTLLILLARVAFCLFCDFLFSLGHGSHVVFEGPLPGFFFLGGFLSL